MGKRGPKQTPTAIVKQKGYYQPSKHKDDIADSKALNWVYKNNIPYPPDSLDEVGKSLWNNVLYQASNLYGYISFIDLIIFEEYCQVYSEIKELREVTKGERTYKDDIGVKRINPEWVEMNKLRRDLVRLSGEFGLTPSSRTRINLSSEREEEIEDSYEL